MSEHQATIEWERDKPDFTYTTYTREHSWTFGGGSSIRASAAPDYKGDASLVNPEEAFVAALSSCYMLTFLALATKKRFVVDHYSDRAVGRLGKLDNGRLAMTKVVLRPRVEFAEGSAPTSEELAEMHHKAHEHCFIANSVTTEVTVEEPATV
jgi:organic hydroperoxide reductase OsmC/OhrA